MSEFILAGTAASLAGMITNPLEVVKTRVQLQGELKMRGEYTRHYKNVFHAFLIMGKEEGVLSLQKGLTPAIVYQFCMNGVRLGCFQCIDNLGVTRDKNGQLIAYRVGIASAFSGALGSFVASPFYMIKTQLQAKSSASKIAVGHQHEYTSLHTAVPTILKSQGIRGLWRGASASILRTSIASCVQLSTFSMVDVHLLRSSLYLQNNSIMSTFISSVIGGIAVSTAMTPFDVVSTRLYNQPTDPVTLKGLKYQGIYDCFSKIYLKEGFAGFYKGWSASVIRTGPHTVLSLCFWKLIRTYYLNFKANQ